MLIGYGDVSDIIMEQRVIDGCFSVLFPKKEWQADVLNTWHWMNGGKIPLGEHYLKHEYYDNELRKDVERHFKLNYFKHPAWTYEELVWFNSQGLLGEQPPAWKRRNLTEFRIETGKRIPQLLLIKWDKM